MFHHTLGGIAVIEATSCGGVVIFRGKILLLYKNYKNKYEGWVLPKGTVESGEEFKDTAIREVREETGANATVIQYIGKSQYTFSVPEDTVEKEVHWYLMMGPRRKNISWTPVSTSITRLIIC
jgi:ADP-ribose pyrophosphatase YjhB (NUDIX family)